LSFLAGPYRSNGPGASVELLLYVLYNVYAHVAVIKYLLTYLFRSFLVRLIIVLKGLMEIVYNGIQL